MEFDHAYYDRYYFDPRTAVTSRAEMRARARLIGAFIAHVGLPVRRMLDAGCGTGLLREPLLRTLKELDAAAKARPFEESLLGARGS